MTAPAAPRHTAAPDWWARPGLDVVDDRLRFAGRDAEALAREHGTPLYLYDLERYRENARRFQAALATTGLPFRLRFAMKANPDPAVLAAFRGLGAPGSPTAVGIDACSPGEVSRALEAGFRADEISYTGTNVSERDFDVILGAGDGLRLNLDAISQVERVGRRAPGRRIGLRVNPARGAGYHAGLEYSGEVPTKFGIHEERLDEAVEVAARHGLVVETVHFHAGSGWLAEGLPAFEGALVEAARMTRHLLDRGCPIDEVNVGGGLGGPGRQTERPVDLEAYAAVLARHLGPLGVTVACEPGDHLAKDAGVLLAEVVTVEDRRGTRFVGLDAGWNIHCGYFVYGFLNEVVPCRDPLAERTWTVGIAGHINEAHDTFADAYPFPPVAEGDVVAILGTGAYAEAMASTHCLRPIAPALHLERDAG
ncbi:MAG TPA: hypothetical protein VFX65_07675 [Candidatus Limnocylindrales bacterium]|nr:hypothetical protein [Candidatus Limnocylindrales bacterium]